MGAASSDNQLVRPPEDTDFHCMSNVNVVFMGSEVFSLPILRSLASDEADAGLHLTGIVTQPDRPAGRGRRLAENPVKKYGVEHNVPVLQPERLRDDSSVAEVLGLKPDLTVVASYGQIVPRVVLDAPGHGSLNLHPSLLPRYRGASPVSGPILAGDPQTGVTLMLMRPKMDAGPILAQETVPIDPRETAGELEIRLADMSAQLLNAHIGPWLRGEIRPVEQDDGLATYTTRLEKSDGAIDWEQPAELIARQVRAFNPWPVAFTHWRGRLMRILRAHALPGHDLPGRVSFHAPEPLTVGTRDGLLAVDEIQLAGGKPMRAVELVRGYPALVGADLGRPN